MLLLCWGVPRQPTGSPLTSSSSLLQGHLSLREPQPPATLPAAPLQMPCRHLREPWCHEVWEPRHSSVWHPEARTLPAAGAVLEGPRLPRAVLSATRTPGLCSGTQARQAGTYRRWSQPGSGDGRVSEPQRLEPPEVTTPVQKTHMKTRKHDRGLSRNRAFKGKPEAFLPPHHNVQALEGQGPSGWALPALPRGAQQADLRYRQRVLDTWPPTWAGPQTLPGDSAADSCLSGDPWNSKGQPAPWPQKLDF